MLRVWTILTIILLVGSTYGSQDADWLRKEAMIPSAGTTEWTLVLTTGHFGKDPKMAHAMRDLATRMLFEVGSKGDKVRIISAEMTPWGTPILTDLSQLRENLPTAPAPSSRGGHDIERILQELAPTVHGPLLILATGDSQLPSGTDGQLVGGDGRVPGFNRPVRKDLSVPTETGVRIIRAIVLTKPGLFHGLEVRKPLALASTEGQTLHLRDEQNQRIQPFPWKIPGIIAGCIIAALLVAKTRRPTPFQPLPAIRTPELATGLDEWKAETKAYQKKLDMLSQDLADAAGKIEALTMATDVELRQDAQRTMKAIDAWDETAMNYLDGISRFLAEPNVPESQRVSWERAFDQFARLAQRNGLDIIAPRPGDPIIDGQHKINQIVPSQGDLNPMCVAKVVSTGFRKGDKVLRPAEVFMVGN